MCEMKDLQYTIVPGLEKLHTDYYMELIIVHNLNDYDQYYGNKTIQQRHRNSFILTKPGLKRK
jgi:hypothetical protein